MTSVEPDIDIESLVGQDTPCNVWHDCQEKAIWYGPGHQCALRFLFCDKHYRYVKKQCKQVDVYVVCQGCSQTFRHDGRFKRNVFSKVFGKVIRL